MLKILEKFSEQWKRSGRCWLCRKKKYCQHPCKPKRKRSKHLNDAEYMKASNWRQRHE